MQDATIKHRNYYQEFGIGIFVLVQQLIYVAANHDDKEALEDARKYLIMIIDDSKEKGDILISINTKIILSKIELIEEQYDAARTLLFTARELIGEKSYAELSQEIENLIATIDNMQVIPLESGVVALSMEDQIKHGD